MDTVKKMVHDIAELCESQLVNRATDRECSFSGRTDVVRYVRNSMKSRLIILI